jgi:serine/threonine protein kinase
MVARTKTSFLDRLRASRLLDNEQINAAVAATSQPPEGAKRRLARYLLQEGLLTRFQVRQLLAGATRFHVDKYIVVDCLGRGGHGVVYKARHHLMPQRFVALKTVDATSLHKSEDALPRFRREIDILARLEHPNVVRAYDVLRTRTQLYLVLEYIEGRDLASLVKERGPLPVPEAVGYVLQAARALSYAHRCGIVHRDLKPANLLVTRNGIVKLSDLGLARFQAQEPSAELTLKGICLGTLEYMAPEQAEDAARADQRSDLFSLGATLFHLLTGRLHVSGSSYVHCLTRLLTTPPCPLLEARPDLPVGLAAVVDRLRARDPDDRPATADEAIALLEPFAVKTLAVVPEHWDGRGRAAVVLDLLRGKLSVTEAAWRYGVPADELERWRQRFLEGAERALDSATGLPGTRRDNVHDLHAKIGAQAVEIESLKNRLAGRE